MDPLSVFMILIVSGVSTLIHLYSISYMDEDRGFARYFAYLNFFVFSMLLLVLAGNFLLLIVGWAFVGAASYLLISFWYRRTTATKAGIKAFVINVRRRRRAGAGDVLHLQAHAARSTSSARSTARAARVSRSGEGDLVAGCVLLLVGAFAKSAQIPLHTWLPDAMEGPTPVSALIHAATMVTAGVYLIARMHPLFELAPGRAGRGRDRRRGDAADRGHDRARADRHQARDRLLDDVADRLHDHGRLRGRLRGGHVSPDDARLLQGAAVHGAPARSSARWPASSRFRQMGGFRKAMPFTFGCFVIGGLALSGIPPFSGFFSKDEILLVTGERGGWHWALYVVGYIGAFLTAIYTFRMIFRAFYGEPGGRGARARSAATCTTPSSRRTPRTARSRTPTWASPARTTRSPSGRCRCASR